MKQVKKVKRSPTRESLWMHSKRVYTLVAVLTLLVTSRMEASEAEPYAKAEANARERIALQVAGNCIRFMRKDRLSQQAIDQNRQVVQDLEKASTALLIKLFKEEYNEKVKAESIKQDLLDSELSAHYKYDELEEQGRTYSSICTEYWRNAAKRMKELINVEYPTSIYSFR